MMGKFPKYIKDDLGRMYQIVGGQIERNLYEPDKFVFECCPMDLNRIDFSTNYFDIEKVIYNDPATIVFWADGTKTVVKCGEEDIYDYQTGLLMCIAKKAYGNKGKFNDILRKWIPEDEEEENGPILRDIFGFPTSFRVSVEDFVKLTGLGERGKDDA